VKDLRLPTIQWLALATACSAFAQGTYTSVINPLEGGWPFKCSDRPTGDSSSNCMVQGFGRAVDDTIFNVDSGWFPPYNGYHLAYDVEVIYSSQDLTSKNYRKVIAPVTGRVMYAGIVVGYTVVIQFDLLPGDPDGPSVTGVFYHMLRPADGGISHAPGQMLNAGDTLGLVSPFWKDHQSVPHEHFGIRKGAYQPGKDSRTGFWFYPGYTTICQKSPATGACEVDPVSGTVIREDDRTDPLHAQIISEWFNPYDFLLRHPQWLSFLTGNPGVPGNGLTIAPGPSSLPLIAGSPTNPVVFQLSPIASFAGMTDGFTLTVFPSGLSLDLVELDFVLRPSSSGCPAVFNFESTQVLDLSQTVSINGVTGYVLNFAQEYLQFFVDQENQFTGCNYTVDDVSLAAFYLDPPRDRLDAAAFGFGQSNVPNLTPSPLIFSNFSDNNFQPGNGAGVGVVGGTTLEDVAVRFVPNGTFKLTSVEIPLSSPPSVPHPGIQVSITTDLNGSPFTVLESFDSTIVPSLPAQTVTFTSILQPELQRGVTYWIMAHMPNAQLGFNDIYLWNFSNSDFATISDVRFNGGAWQPTPQSIPPTAAPAFIVSGTPFAPQISWMSFVQGNPGVPGDGILINAAPPFGEVDLATPFSLAGLESGLTVSVFSPDIVISDLLGVQSVGVLLQILQVPPSCQVGSSSSGPATAGEIVFNSTNGIYINFDAQFINFWLYSANNDNPGCNIQLKDLYIAGFFINATQDTYIHRLDALAIGPGENNFPGTPIP
jgi:hypothetical protein